MFSPSVKLLVGKSKTKYMVDEHQKLVKDRGFLQSGINPGERAG